MDKLVGTRLVLCDIDGVVWLSQRPVPGSVAAISRLRGEGVDVRFVTNSSFNTIRELEDDLESIGVEARGFVLSSAMAAASLVGMGERVFLVGGEGLAEELSHRGATIFPAHEEHDTEDVDAVVVGLHYGFDYATLRRASAAVRLGARLIGANSDATYPTPQGEVPGGGAILAAVERASGVEAVVAGKPNQPMADLVRERLGLTDMAGVVMVGDRFDSDGLFAATLGCTFAHVRTGVAPSNGAPHGDFSDLAEVASAILG